MLHDTWKARLIRFAHLQNPGQPVRPATLSRSPRVILGRTLHKRKSMSQSTLWLNKIQGEVRTDELMCKHTSLRTGGPADWYIEPKDLGDLQLILKNKGDLPLFIIGEGSNLLVSDRGIRGLVVSLKGDFRKVEVPEFFKDASGQERARIKVGAGTKMSYLVKFAARYGLTGMEDLVGIPGSLGGALVMNAGADGTETGQVVQSVTAVMPSGELRTWKREDLKFAYRKTTFPEPGGIIVSAELELAHGDTLKIQNRIDEHLKRRSHKQPLSLPNSGSVFKNPEGDTAGRLIEAAGLKGFTVGEASVSIRHANFIVNKGAAQSSDVLQVIEHVKETVKEECGVELETEVIIAGDWS